MSEREEKLARREKLRDSDVERLRRMIEIRRFEDRIRDLFFEGRVHGTTHTCQGQEAVSVGIAAAARPTDMVACTYRGHGHALALGMTPSAVMAEIMGRTTGCVGGVGGSMHLADPDVGLLPTFAIVGAGIPVAAGVGLTAQIRGTEDVGIAIFGDGTANIGAFHEGINLAAIWSLPVVFVCENNMYGEYSRIDKTTPIDDIATRATAYGIPGEVVDGQDVYAVVDSMEKALERARAGGGPTLLEMKTYRYAGHSRADTAPYRPDGELEEWSRRDPIALLRDRLIERGTLSQQDVDALDEEMQEEVEKVVDSASSAPRPGWDAMFRNVVADAQ